MSSRFVGLCLSVGYQRPLLTHCWSLEADISRLVCARSVVLSKHNGGTMYLIGLTPYSTGRPLILYFLLHSKTCKYDWSNMSQFVRAHFIQMLVCVFVICYIKNVVKYDFIYTVTENQHSCNFECRFLWSHTSVPGLHFICECSIYLG